MSDRCDYCGRVTEPPEVDRDGIVACCHAHFRLQRAKVTAGRKTKNDVFNNDSLTQAQVATRFERLRTWFKKLGKRGR